MDPEIMRIVFYIIGSIAVVAVIVYLMLRYLLNPKKIQAEVQRNRKAQEDPWEPQFTTREIQATLIDQSCSVKLIGTKTPKAAKVFTVVFQTENNEILSFQVPEEMYDGFDKGQAGILTIVDGELYGFALDKSMEDM